MNGNNDNENHILDGFLEDTPSQQHHGAHMKEQPHRHPEYPQPYPTAKKRYPAIIVLLSAILIIGIAILTMQILRPSENTEDNTPGVNNNENYYKQENGNNPGDDGQYYYNPDDGGNGPQFHQGPDNGVPQLQGPGPADGEGDSVLNRRGVNGKKEYSIDGGKTWSETPPEGYNNTP